MHSLLKQLFLLALLGHACAPPPRSVCFNPDPASGACRDAELQQAEKNKAHEVRTQRRRRLADIKQALQLANTQLAEKKEELSTANNPLTVTRLSREHDAIVTEINDYVMEAEFELGENLGPKADKIAVHKQPITLQLKHDIATSTLRPVLGGLDQAREVRASYRAMQHKFVADASQGASPAEEMAVLLPPTLQIALQLQFILDEAIYCGHIVVDAAGKRGGEVETQLAGEGGC